MEIRRMSAGGIDFPIKEEGMVLKPYLCAGKVPTIGVG
jgi:GH24 family phage-related lysozyme (muramidase)